MTTTTNTKDALIELAYTHNWVLQEDLGWSITLTRFPGLDVTAKETLTVFFAENPRQSLTGASHVFPIGDRYAGSGKPVMAAEGLTNRNKNKFDTISYWLTRRLYAKRGHNALLAKLGMDPVLEEPVRPPWTGNGNHTLLLSAASADVYGPDLVTGELFEHAIDATDKGERIKQASGLEYEVMREVGGKWISVKGETPEEVIKRRWTP